MFIRKVFLMLAVSALFACQSKVADEVTESQEEQVSALAHLPAWVLSPAIEGTIAAVGIAPASAGGLQFEIPKAEADARANIAAQINVEISRLTKNA